MAGTMNKACIPFRPLLTEHLLLGTPLPADLARHLDQCPECTRAASETDDVVRTLQRADPLAGWTGARASATQARPSKELSDRIRHVVADAESARPRIRPRRRIALGAAAAFVTAAAVIAPFALDQSPGQDQPPVTSVALVREGKMVERPGGTEVPVALSGLKAGETYRMMTVNASGARASGGSIRAVSDAQVSTRMVTAMRKNTITALIIEDEEGHVVTHLPVLPPPSGAAPSPAA
ncbi:hypothetical protein [Streptomyces zagrosensis]|uniref:Zinc-finger domain-containing protein n=1 Tax=Streptomyces zagrosensis TaxID=1042984 RepID=A0A7W9Q5D5_9ACTN|nr:hypothetical protein [Streptomyces zagrosensis]MBB5933950.1 hypothetical protein [Streptomyces zagrosensis]